MTTHLVDELPGCSSTVREHSTSVTVGVLKRLTVGEEGNRRFINVYIAT